MNTERRFRAIAPFAPVTLSAFLALGCTACDGDDAGGEDTGTGTETGIDTSFDFGETTPCVNEAQPGEVCVPGGNYLMGCVPGDDECEDNEKPLVAVTLSPFFIDMEEATIGDLIAWMNDVKDDPGFVTSPYFGWTDGTTLHRLWGAVWDTGNLEYVDYVLRDGDGNYYFNQEAESSCPNQGGIEAAAGGFSWLGAKMYCEWKGGRVLPTEAQWEAAARGQTFNEFPCGSDLQECWYGVYACCSAALECGMYQSTWCRCCAPLAVEYASTCDSPFGVKGMYGNAMEWTADYYFADHSACINGCVDPQPSTASPEEGVGHLVKDGSISSLSQSELRISIRWGGGDDQGHAWMGVRCVRPDESSIPYDAGLDGGK